MLYYNIGVRAKDVVGTNMVKYEGRCYYRLGSSGNTNVVPTSSIELYYPPGSALAETLSTFELSAGACNAGEKILNKNEVLTVPYGNGWFQFKHTVTRSGDYSLLKFIKSDGTFFVKTLKLVGQALIFDGGGEHEYTFNVNNYPDTFSFTADGAYYDLTYAAKGSAVFIINYRTDPAIVTTPTPTPTPTSTDSPDGKNFYANASWASSGTELLSMWYDSAAIWTLEPTTGMSIAGASPTVKMWRDRGPNGYDLFNTTADYHHPAYIAPGSTGIGGGPSLEFTQRFGLDKSTYLEYDSGSQGLDHRAAFIVASTPILRGDGVQGLVTAQRPDGGAAAAYGNMFTIEASRSHWYAVNIGGFPRQSIYSNTYTGGDGGQYYLNGLAVPDNESVVPALDGAIYGGIRTNPAPALLKGLSVGATHALAAGTERAWDGNIGEIIILDDIPSDELREDIEGYLAWKWGLVDYLPAGHRCKLAPCEPIPPTPTPEPPPSPTPTEVPLVVTGPPDGVNLLTMPQLFDAITHRHQPVTLWLGGQYENEWLDTKSRIDAVTSTTSLYDTITGSIHYTGEKFMSGVTPMKTESWSTNYYDTDDVVCPDGTGNSIRMGIAGTATDNVDSRIMYCLGGFEAGSMGNIGDSLHSILSYELWTSFTEAVTHNTPSTVKYVEDQIKIPIKINTPSYSYNTLDADLPLTAVYYLPCNPDNPSPLSLHGVPPLHLDQHVTRFDVGMQMMYHAPGLLFWQPPIRIGHDITLEVTVNVPGTYPDISGYFNLTGNLPWQINVEIVDRSDNTAVFKSIATHLPATMPNYIPAGSADIEITDIAGYKFKITPYAGAWKSTSSSGVIHNAENGIPPSLFFRVDKELM